MSLTPFQQNCFDESAAFSCNSPWPAQCGPVPPGRSAGSPADFAQLQQLEASDKLTANRLSLPNESQDFQAVQTRAPPAQPIASVDNNQVQSSPGNAFQGFSFSNGHANSFGVRTDTMGLFATPIKIRYRSTFSPSFLQNFKIEAP